MRNVVINKFFFECKVWFKIEFYKYVDICLNISWEGIVNIYELIGGCFKIIKMFWKFLVYRCVIYVVLII